MSAAGSLQKAIYQVLSGDAALTTLIGADGVRDHLHKQDGRPCVFLAGIESRDASTASEKGEEHLVTIEARTGEGGNRLALQVADRVRALLDDVHLNLVGFTLIGLLHRRTRTGRETGSKGHVAEMTFRAVTEG